MLSAAKRLVNRVAPQGDASQVPTGRVSDYGYEPVEFDLAESTRLRLKHGSDVQVPRFFNQKEVEALFGGEYKNSIEDVAQYGMSSSGRHTLIMIDGTRMQLIQDAGGKNVGAVFKGKVTQKAARLFIDAIERPGIIVDIDQLIKNVQNDRQSSPSFKVNMQAALHAEKDRRQSDPAVTFYKWQARLGQEYEWEVKDSKRKANDEDWKRDMERKIDLAKAISEKLMYGKGFPRYKIDQVYGMLLPEQKTVEHVALPPDFEKVAEVLGIQVGGAPQPLDRPQSRQHHLRP